MADPEVQNILKDPVVQNVLRDLQVRVELVCEPNVAWCGVFVWGGVYVAVCAVEGGVGGAGGAVRGGGVVVGAMRVCAVGGRVAWHAWCGERGVAAVLLVAGEVCYEQRGEYAPAAQ